MIRINTRKKQNESRKFNVLGDSRYFLFKHESTNIQKNLTISRWTHNVRMDVPQEEIQVCNSTGNLFVTVSSTIFTRFVQKSERPHERFTSFLESRNRIPDSWKQLQYLMVFKKRWTQIYKRFLRFIIFECIIIYFWNIVPKTHEITRIRGIHHPNLGFLESNLL